LFGTSLAKITFIAVGVSTALLPYQANAEDSMCGSEVALESLVGNYLMGLNHPILYSKGKVLPLSATDSFPIEISVEGDKLAIAAGGEIVLLDMLGGSSPSWAAEDTLSFALSPEVMAAELACSYNDLPRFIGTGFSQSQEGTIIYYTYRLVAFSEANDRISFAGSLVWDDAGTVEMARTVFVAPN